MSNIWIPNSYGRSIIKRTESLDSRNPYAQGLVGYWRMDKCDGEVVHDCSGQNNYGRPINGPTWVLENDGWMSASFDGVDDYANIGSNISLKSVGVLTVIIRIYLHTGGAFQELADCAMIGVDDGYFLRLDDSNPPKIQFTVLGTLFDSVIGDMIVLNEWHDIAGIFRGK